MEFHGDPNDPALLPSATVILLRDAAAGLEAFLVKRHGLSEVLGGAYVFPGGKVDAQDAQLLHRLDRDAAELHGLLGEPDLPPAAAAGVFVAAVREVFEETGVLFSRPGAAHAGRAGELLREGRSFGDVLEQLDLTLDTDGLVPWSRWVTPLVGGVMRKRFDTRFFVAAVPPGQEPVHDAYEATESAWLPPRVALEQYWERQIQFAPPQIMTLAYLSRFASVMDVLAHARSRKPACVRPEGFQEDGARVICYPGDELHSQRERAMPGPVRLRWRHERFEPCTGDFDDFFR